MATISKGGVPFLVAVHEDSCTHYFDVSILRDFLKKIYHDGYRNKALKDNSIDQSDDGSEADDLEAQINSLDVWQEGIRLPLGQSWSEADLQVLKDIEGAIARPFLQQDALDEEKRQREDRTQRLFEESIKATVEHTNALQTVAKNQDQTAQVLQRMTILLEVLVSKKLTLWLKTDSRYFLLMRDVCLSAVLDQHDASV